MRVKELKKILKKCNDVLEIQFICHTHEHLYNSLNKELGSIDIDHIVPVKSISIKNDDGYGYVILSNMED